MTDDMLTGATEAWRRWCRTLEATGAEVLARTLTDDEIDLAEGVRHLARMATLTLVGSFENKDAGHPYFWPALDPHRKMGGDNPQGLYLSAPVNGTDTFVVRGTRGSARWVSMLTGRGPTAHAAGLEPFGHALFAPDLLVEHDGTFEVVISPDPHAGNWVRSDEHSATFLVRQFFGTPHDVDPMQLTIENRTRGDLPPAPLALAGALEALGRAGAMFARMVPMMQAELLAKGAAKNTFATDIGDPTSTSGGVPGGNAVTARWALEPDEALVIEVVPPTPCAYWDVQVGNGWYESFDYRHVFSGLTCEGVHTGADGSAIVVLAQHDPGTANWLETAHHREGHIAVRWQLTEGRLPLPRTTVMKVSDVRARVDLPVVTPAERATARAALGTSFARRFTR
jgi:hypothetical protein